MNLAILQLSDIHIRLNENPILERIHLIRSAIQPRLPDECALLTVYSGDIAFSGQKDEYRIARDFVRQVSTDLKQISGMHILGKVVVPGNHDCDFSLTGDARPIMLSSVAANLRTVDLNGELIDQLLKVETNFFDFERENFEDSGRDAEGRIFSVTSFS